MGIVNDHVAEGLRAWDGDPEEDPDKVRRAEAIRAVEAFNKGMTVGLRILSSKACDWCENADPIVNIWDIIEGKADHPQGLCTWEFFPSYQDASAELSRRMMKDFVEC